MSILEIDALRGVDKFSGENFNLWKFKVKMILAKKDLWEIVEGSEERPEDPRRRLPLW